MRNETRGWRRHATYGVLLLGWWTTVATSESDVQDRGAELSTTLGPAKQVHVTVITTRSTLRSAGSFAISFFVSAIAESLAERDQLLVELTPDEPGLEKRQLDLAQDATPCDASFSCDDRGGADVADDAGAFDPNTTAGWVQQSHSYQDERALMRLCPEKGPCRLGFTVARDALPGDRGRPVLLEVKAVATPALENGLSCASERDFPDDAMVEVQLDE